MAVNVMSKTKTRSQPSAFLLTIPRQHGAWSVLAAGFILGAIVGGRLGKEGLLLLGALLSGFLARHAVGLLLRPAGSEEQQRKIRRLTLGYVAHALLLGGLLVIRYDRWLLVPLGVVALVLALVSLHLERQRQDRTTVGELVNLLGLSLAIPATAYATSGVFEAATAGWWTLGLLFFSGSVFHVRYLVRKRRESSGPLAARWRAGWPSVVYHLAALGVAAGLSALGTLPSLAFLALLPVTVKALGAVVQRREGPLNIRHIGYAELAHTVLFVALAGWAVR